MISSELLSMQEILTNSIYKYDISNEFLNWMKYKHYPIVSCTPESRFSFGRLSQNFGTSNGKWWIPTRLVLRSVSFEDIPSSLSSGTYVLSSQYPISDISYPQDNWIMIDIRKAGKYISKLFIFIFIFIHFM